MAELLLPKQLTRVRFPSPAQKFERRLNAQVVGRFRVAGNSPRSTPAMIFFPIRSRLLTELISVPEVSSFNSFPERRFSTVSSAASIDFSYL